MFSLVERQDGEYDGEYTMAAQPQKMQHAAYGWIGGNGNGRFAHKPGRECRQNAYKAGFVDWRQGPGLDLLRLALCHV